MSDIGDFDDLSTHEFADTIKATEGDDFDIIDESKIQGDIQRAYGIFLELNPNASVEDNPELVAFSEDLHNILADFDAAGRDKEEALYDLEDEIYALLEPIFKEDAFRVLEKSFYSVYDFILELVDFVGGKRSFSFEYDGEVVAGSFNREYRIEVVEIGDKRIEFNPPCSPRRLEQSFLFFKRALDRITERDDIYSFFDTAPTFVALDPLRFDFFIDRGDGPVKYVATPFDVLRVDEESERQMETQEEEYRRKKRDIGSMIRRGSYQGDWLKTAYELRKASRISRTLYDDETGSKVEEVTSVDHEFNVSRSYADGDKFSRMDFSEYGASSSTDVNGNVTFYDSQLKPIETMLIDNGRFDGHNFYDSSGRPLWGRDRENLPFLVQPDGSHLYDFALMREREPQLTTQDFFDSWEEIIRTADDYYAFEEQFLTINEGDIPYRAEKLVEIGAWQPLSEPEMSDIEALHLVQGHLREAFPEDLQLMMREHAKKLTGVAALEASIEQKYGIEIESDDWTSFGPSDLTNMRMELPMLRRVLKDLDASLYKIHPVALKRTGLKKIYVFKFWQGPGISKGDRQMAGGYALSNGEIGIVDGDLAFFHELGHCADEHEGGWHNDDEYWGRQAHGEGYESLYGESGVAAIASGMGSSERPEGFADAYAKYGGIGEEQASMSEHLFSDYRLMMKLAEQEPELARKVEMTKHFWLWLSDPNGGESYDPTATYNGYMNDQYWEDLADDKVARSGVRGPGYWDS